MPKRSIKLGDEAEDIVSKVRGVVIGEVKYLDGTLWWIIQPAIGEDDRKPPEHYAPKGYCRRTGDGVYPSVKPVMGFVAPEKD
jgi:hypothetical protein